MSINDLGTIVVIGGTGSLGTALIERLLPQTSNPVYSLSRDELKQFNQLHAYSDHQHFSTILADVRDYIRIEQVLKKVDTVFLLAALKQVPKGDADPMEFVQTNIIGTWNVARAAIKNRVKRVVFTSSDKACLYFSNVIDLAEGESTSIYNIVRNHVRADVRTLGEDGKFTTRPITNWYKNHLGSRRLFLVSYRTAPYSNGGRRQGATVTEDHLILTPDGWMQAASIIDGTPIVTGELAPNKKQMELLVGTLLGDSTIALEERQAGPRLSLNPRPFVLIGHALDQYAWTELKHGALSGLKPLPIHTYPNPLHGQPFCRFKLPSAGYCVDMYKDFMLSGEHRRKQVPRNLVEKYFSPMLMAAWVMDDGFQNGSNAFRIATQGFYEDDVRWLAKLLTGKEFAAWAYQHKTGGNWYWELRLSVKGSEALAIFIAPYIIPSLRYKLPPRLLVDLPDYDPDVWELGESIPFIDEGIVEEFHSNDKHSVYCIDVEDTHNFIAGNVVVHNCKASTLYGSTKAIAEHIMTNLSKSSNGTKLICTRYGNVLGSRGSVIPIWLAQAAAGKLLTITDRGMTRFWLTMQQAVDFLLMAASGGNKGEVWVPLLPAMSLVDVADVISPGEQDIIGLRLGGEKLHEELVCEEEAMAVSRVGNSFMVLEPGRSGRGIAGSEYCPYRSDNPIRFVTQEEMRGFIEEFKGGIS